MNGSPPSDADRSGAITRVLDSVFGVIEKGINALASGSARFWPLSIIVVVGALVVSVWSITNFFYFEADLTKFLPKDYATIKSDDYYRQNYNHQDFALVGIEVDPDYYETVWDPAVMRMMERIIQDLKGVTATKTFDSLLTGQAETVTLPIGFDVENIQSIANLEDIILDEETNALRTGRINRSIKEDLAIFSASGEDDLLPASDADLARLIPILREHVMADPLFRGVIVSEDERAAMIQVPMQRKWDYMRRYIRDELATALSVDRLTRRFKGEFTDFPHNIWGQTLDGITVDEAFVSAHVALMREKVQAFMFEYYQPVFGEYPELQQLLEAELTAENFLAAMQILEDKDLYQNPAMNVWERSTNDLYSFALANLDPFSRDNINFQVYDPKQFVEVGYNADQIQNTLDANILEGTEGYITGYEYIIALLGKMMGADVQRLLRYAVLVDIIVLFVAFRNLRGMVIPMVTVVGSMLMALGTMFYFGVPLSLTTFIIPIVLLAVGTAYGIHVINRYAEDSYGGGPRLRNVRNAYRHVGMAVFMAGLTTAAGLGSLAVTDLKLIAHFGVFSAVGTGYAILLTFVLTPALLRLWPTQLGLQTRLDQLHEAGIGTKLLWSLLLPLYLHLIWFSRPLERFHTGATRPVRLIAAAIVIAAAGGIIYYVGWVLTLPFLAQAAIIFLVFFIFMHLALDSFFYGPRLVRQPYGVEGGQTSGTLLDKMFNVFGWTVVKHYKLGLTISALLMIGATYLAFGNYFESGIIYNFKETNAIYQSDRFINRTLSGSYSIQLLFQFRDELALSNEEIVSDLQSRIDGFTTAWNSFTATDSALRYEPFNALLGELALLDDQPQPSARAIQEKVDVIRDILNEEYRVSSTSADPVAPQTAAMTIGSASNGGDLNALDSLDSLDDLDSLASLDDLLVGDDTLGDGDELQGGINDIRKRMGINGGLQLDQFVAAVRQNKSNGLGLEMQRAFNELNDIFAMDIKQPRVLNQLLALENYTENIQEPMIDVDGYQMAPIGTVISPTDIARKVYRVLYHGGDYSYDKLPQPGADGLADPTATERSVLGSVINQAMSSDRDAFNRGVRSELNEFTFTVLTRAGESQIITPLATAFEEKARELFPENDPYISKITLSGRSPRSMEVTLAIADSQGYSIGTGVLLVGLLCWLLFRSLQGGIYSMIPLAFTIMMNFAVINLLGFAITVMVMVVGAIAIGTGVDYTIHFLERYKIQIGKGDDPVQAYLNTLHTSGKAIFHNAVSVALGFSVLILSDFKGNIQMGILMMGTMIFASLAALTTLPALIFWLKPKFVAHGKSINVL